MTMLRQQIPCTLSPYASNRPNQLSLKDARLVMDQQGCKSNFHPDWGPGTLEYCTGAGLSESLIWRTSRPVLWHGKQSFGLK